MLREIEREYLEKTRSLTPAIHHYHPDASPEEMKRYLKELTADMEYHLKNEKLCRFPAFRCRGYLVLRENEGIAHINRQKKL